MFTMTRFMSSDGAMDIVETLNARHPFMWVFFMFFQALFQYVLLNLVTAVICDRALHLVEADEERKIAEAQEEQERQIAELTELFKLLDADGGGSVSLQEFQRAFSIPAMANKLIVLGISESDLIWLFKILDSDGGGDMSVEEFSDGIPKMFGQATSFDMLAGRKGAEKVDKRLGKLIKEFEDGAPGNAGAVVGVPDAIEYELLETELLVEERLIRLEEMVASAGKHVARIAAVMG